MKNTLKDIFIACYVAISLHFIRRILCKTRCEDTHTLDAMLNLPVDARIKLYSDAYTKPEYALVGYKGKRGFKGMVIDTGLVIMPDIIKPQELKDAADQLIGKPPDAPIMFIQPKNILNDTDKRQGY